MYFACRGNIIVYRLSCITEQEVLGSMVCFLYFCMWNDVTKV